MLKYFYFEYLKRKNIIIYILLVIIYSLSLYFMTNPFAEKADYLLNVSKFNSNYLNISIFIYKYLLIVSLTLFLVDNDSLQTTIILAYKNRIFVSFYKLLFYIFLSSSVFLSFFSIYYLITKLSLINVNFNYKESLYFYFDLIIYTIICLIFVRKNNKNIIYFLMILFIILDFLLIFINKYKFIIYILPLSKSLIFNYKLGELYVFIFIIFLVYLYMLKVEYENIQI